MYIIQYELYSMDHKGLGVAHKKHHLKSASLFPDDERKYWLGKTKPNQAFRST